MKDLSKRKYKCKKYGHEIERDYNSSINILIEGLNNIAKERLLN